MALNNILIEDLLRPPAARLEILRHGWPCGGDMQEVGICEIGLPFNCATIRATRVFVLP